MYSRSYSWGYILYNTETSNGEERLDQNGRNRGVQIILFTPVSSQRSHVTGWITVCYCSVLSKLSVQSNPYLHIDYIEPLDNQKNSGQRIEDRGQRIEDRGQDRGWRIYKLTVGSGPGKLVIGYVCNPIKFIFIFDNCIICNLYSSRFHQSGPSTRSLEIQYDRRGQKRLV